ncbi:MAG: lipopolysaccharide heptosyltransferase II [Candidatus Omnitrophica bacterium]|nr:lipopolysaccharide heptosyltransferase II [Candidatus Omnitrophota bacterium]
MKILQLLPNLNIGGVEKSTLEVSRYLKLNGHVPIVVSGGGSHEKTLAATGIRHYRLPVDKKNVFTMLYSYFKLRDIIRRESVDIVHARSRVPALIGYFACKKEKVTFITTAHGQYRKHLMSKVMGWGKIVIVASEVMLKHKYENFGVPKDKMVIIPRGVDLDSFSFILPSSKNNKIPRIGMIARFTPLKGHLDFLKAVSYVLRKYPQIEVVLMGDIKNADKNYVKEVTQKVRHLALDRYVKFIGADQDVSDVLATFDVFVSANRAQEAFGRSIIEAQSRGVPVVATKVGGAVENIQDGRSGLLCEPANPKEMAEKILEFLEDIGFRDNVALNARKYVEENFALEELMKKKLELYEKILNYKKILVFKLSSLGDIILSIPSLRAIRKKFPEGVIKVMVDKRFKDVLENVPCINGTIPVDLNGEHKGMNLLKLAKEVRAQDFDISLDLQNNRKSHVLAYLGAIPVRAGFSSRKWSFLLNRKAHLPEKPMDPVEHQLLVLKNIGIGRIDKELELWTRTENDEWVEKFLLDNWIQKDQKIVGFSMSASEKWKSKNWPSASFQELAAMLGEEKSIRVVLLGSAEQSKVAEDITSKLKTKPVNAVGLTDIGRFISLVKKCSLVVTGDSASMHVAAAVKTPFVALFGPTDPKRHAPFFRNSEIIRRKIKCSPCYKGTCTVGYKCMAQIRPREVFGAVTRLMK